MARRKKKIIWNRFFMFIFIIYAIFVIVNQQVKIAQMNKQKDDIIDKIELVQRENEKLEDTLQYTSTEEYIEKMAREKLGLIKSNEIVYIDQSLTEGYLQEGGN